MLTHHILAILGQTHFVRLSKKKYVSCPAGGHNCGLSGSRKFFFPHLFLFGRKRLSFFFYKN